MTNEATVNREGGVAGTAAVGRGGTEFNQVPVAIAVGRDVVRRNRGAWIAYGLVWLWVLAFPLLYMGFQPVDAETDAMAEVWRVEYYFCLVGTLIGSIAAAYRVSEYAFGRTAADFYGTLPLCRGPLFTATALAGFVPLVIAEAAVAAVLLVLDIALPAIGMLNIGCWLALAVLSTFVFYGTALLCVQLAGTKTGAVWLFAGANALIAGIEFVVRMIAGELLWGVAASHDSWALAWTSPLLGMWQYGFAGLGASSADGLAATAEFPGAFGLFDWGVLGWYVLVGAAFALIAYRLNATRPFERAGEPYPHAWERGIAFCGAGVVAAVAACFCVVLFESQAFGSPLDVPQAAVAGIVAAICGFLGTALSAAGDSRGDARTVRTFWRVGFVVGAVAFALVMCCAFDVLGWESRVPETSQVESVTVRAVTDGSSATFTSSDGIDQVRTAHTQMLGLRDDAKHMRLSEDDSTTVAFTYRLTSGSTVQRLYTVPTQGKADKKALGAIASALNSREGADSRLADLQHAGSDVLTITYTTSSGDDEYYVPDARVNEFVNGPLSSDVSRDHHLIDVDLVDGEGAGDLGDVSISIESGDEDDDASCFVPVSRKDSPAIAKWLEQEGQVDLS